MIKMFCFDFFIIQKKKDTDLVNSYLQQFYDSESV